MSKKESKNESLSSKKSLENSSENVVLEEDSSKPEFAEPVAQSKRQIQKLEKQEERDRKKQQKIALKAKK